MNSMVFVILMEIFNFTNFTRDGIIRIGFNPYLEILGSYTWGIIFGFIGAGLYANQRSIGTLAIYLILVGVFTAIIIPGPFVAVLGIITALLMAIIFYRAFMERVG